MKDQRRVPVRCTNGLISWLVISVVIVATGCTAIVPTLLPFPPRTYTIVYEQRADQKENGEISKMIASSDGKGHFCYVGISGNVVRIEDYLSGRSYSLNRENKTAGWLDLAGNEPKQLDLDTYTAFQKSSLSRSLGYPTSHVQREIDGHSCVGYWGANYRYWFDRHKGVLVLAEIENDRKPGQTYWIARLEKYSEQPMSPESFKVPTDYAIHHGIP